MKFSFEKPTVRLYNYYFLGIDKPVMIQAYNRDEARNLIRAVQLNLPEIYKGKKIIGETVVVPAFGVTERVHNGKVLVWVGMDFSKNGWMEKDAFRKKFPD